MRVVSEGWDASPHDVKHFFCARKHQPSSILLISGEMAAFLQLKVKASNDMTMMNDQPLILIILDDAANNHFNNLLPL